jgi:hypothetical protein
MLDELQQLRDSAAMVRLLSHYAERGAADRTAWQHRLMEMDSVPPAEIVKLHGFLLGQQWLEMNVGFAKDKGIGVMASCYRITTAGHRALKQAQSADETEEPVAEPAWLATQTRQRPREDISVPETNSDL